MNSDKSQQSQDNWVQKRVRNLEGMSRARHISADQRDEKPTQYNLSIKRNSAPGPLSRRGSLPRSTAREKQMTGLKPSGPPKSRSISPVSVNSSQSTVKITKTETIKPEPPVRKSSFTSPNRLVSSRLLQFQKGLPEAEINDKPSKEEDLKSDDKKISSRTTSATASSPRIVDARPPRQLSKTSNGLGGKSSVSKVTKSKVASASHPSKPSIKPKPTTVSAASGSSKTKSDLKTPSVPVSSRTKSPIHSGSRQTSMPKATKAKLLASKSSHSFSTDSTTVSESKEAKNEEKSVKSVGNSKLPVHRSYSSPKTARKQFGSAKSSSTARSAMKTPSRVTSVPVPTKPKPPPAPASKPYQSKINKAKANTQSSQQPVCSAVSINNEKETDHLLDNEEPVDVSVSEISISLSEDEVPMKSKPNQEALSSTETTDITLEPKGKMTAPNVAVKCEACSPINNGDEDIYNNVHPPNTTSDKSSSSKDDATSSSSKVSMEDNSFSDIGDDTVNLLDVPTKSISKDNSASDNDLAKIKEDASSGHTDMKILSQPSKEKEPISVPLLQQTPDNLIAVDQQDTAMNTDDDIYDDVVVQSTVTVSLQEKSVIDTGIDDQLSVITSTNVTMDASNFQIPVKKQSLSTAGKPKIESCDVTSDETNGGKILLSNQQAPLSESQAIYDDIVYPVPHHKQGAYDNEDFQVAELCVSPRQSRVASFERAGDRNIRCRDSGLGIEAYYDKIDHSGDGITEPAFYDQIRENREQLETISSSEDILQSEGSSENVLVTNLEAPSLPPRSEDMIKEINESSSNLTGTLLEVSTKVIETMTVESGFEDQYFDGDASRDVTAGVMSKAKPDPLVIRKSNVNSPPPLPPRRPRSTQLDADDVPLKSPGYLSQRASSNSPQPTLLPQRKISAPVLPTSPKDFASSSSSLAPSHSAVSIISGRSEDRYPTDCGSDVSSLVDVGSEFASTEHKKEKSKLLGIFTRKKSDKKKKTDTGEDFESTRPRAGSMGQNLHRKKNSRHAIKKKGSVPPEIQFVPPEADYSLPDPLYFADDISYDECTVIRNNYKSPPPNSNQLSNNFIPGATSSSTTLNNVVPALVENQDIDSHTTLIKNDETQISVESLGSFTQNFEDSSGWFDDLYDMVANSGTYITETLDVKLTVTAEKNDDIYDTVASDLPDKGKLGVEGSPNLNRVSSSVDSSGSFDSLEDEEDHLSPLNSELSNSMKGRSLPQRSLRTKEASPTRPKSYSNANQTVEIVKNLQISRSLRPTDDIKEDVMETTLIYADAVWDYDPTQEGDLKFHANDVIEVTDMTDDDWWLGYINDSAGWFPASYVRIRVGQEDNVENNDGDENTTAPQLKPVEFKESGRSFRRTVRRASSEGILDKKLSRSEYRAKIVEEIVGTERTYVKYLEDVAEGYMQRCLTSPHLFTSDRVEVIFGNIADLLKFQKTFLSKLEACATPADMSQSQIGAVFIDHETEFNVYSEYCNNHPYAVNEMNELQEDPQYILFFESCRLLRNLSDLPLEAFLLKPVQKICKYPLQLSELLKYTDSSHPDYVFVKNAVESMKNVASLINSRKRRIENLYKLALWQKAIENWKGDHVVETSSEEIFSGDLQKISKGHSQERHFTLFDHQLVYCKREAISHKLQYRGRIIMDNCRIIDLEDGEEIYGGSPVKNAWKINNEAKNKWYVLYSKDPTIKTAWMDAFDRERQRVQDDATSKFSIPSRLRKMAIAQADKSTKKEVKTKRSVLQDSIEQYGIKQRSVVFQACPNTPKKKGSKKKKTKRAAT